MSKSTAIPLDALLALDNQLCFALYSACRALTRLYTEKLAEFGLTYPQYLVLLVLWEWEREAPARPTVRALGERLGLDSGTLTPLLKRLADKGLLSRERSSEDERELCVRLTSEGKLLRRRVAKVPRELISSGTLSLEQVIGLREQLKSFRDGLAA